MSMYRESGITWIGRIPSDWKIDKIKSMASLSGRIGWQGLTSEEYTDEGAYLITGVDFENGIINWDSCVHVPMKRWKEAIGVQIKEHDLLITKDGTVGKVAIVKNMPYETSLNSGVLLIRPYKEYDNKFLYYVLHSDAFWTWFNLDNAGNSTIIHLYQHRFNNFSFASPSLKEQKVISTFLDEKVSNIDIIIDNLKNQIKLLQSTKKALITDKVTKGLISDADFKDSNIANIGFINKNYKLSKIKYICDIYNGNSISDDLKPNYEDPIAARPYISSKDININTQGVDYANGMYIKVRDKSFRVAFKDSILMCIEGGSAGRKIAYLNRDVSFVNKLCCFKVKNFDSRYLFYTLMSNYFSEEFFLNISGLIGGVSISTIGGMYVVNPPIEEQISIANYLEKKCLELNMLIEEKERAISKLEKYKKSLIFEYVTGKKRVEEEQHAN